MALSLDEEERRIAIEHRDMLLDVRQILSSSSGQRFFKYLFKHFGAGQLPEKGLEGVDLHERIGHLRTGRAIFELASEANAELAGQLLAQNEKERYAQIMADLDPNGSE